MRRAGSLSVTTILPPTVWLVKHTTFFYRPRLLHAHASAGSWTVDSVACTFLGSTTVATALRFTAPPPTRSVCCRTRIFVIPGLRLHSYVPLPVIVYTVPFHWFATRSRFCDLALPDYLSTFTGLFRVMRLTPPSRVLRFPSGPFTTRFAYGYSLGFHLVARVHALRAFLTFCCRWFHTAFNPFPSPHYLFV